MQILLKQKIFLLKKLKKNLSILFLVFFVSTTLFSESSVLFTESGDRILKTEESLNTEINNLNNKLSSFNSILTKKISILPTKVFLKKGIIINDNCEFKTDSSENFQCIKIEHYDFKLNSKSESDSEMKKVLILFFDSSGKLTKIASKIYIDDFQLRQKKIIEIIDTDPTGKTDLNEKVFFRFQNPSKIPTAEEILIHEKEFIKLNLMENSKQSPIRNQFKREAYIKHLKSFEQLLSRIDFQEK